jgi:C4-dicarboxylate-specific signal transduction histidine kinase
MQRWGIDDALLPSNSMVMFQERSLWDEYRYHAGAFFLLLALETGLIAGLLFERRWRRQAELDAARKGSELAHLSRVTMVGSLSTSIAHELNQPLAAILINAQAARMLIGKSPPDCNEVRQILDDIIADERRASEIITGLRSMLAKREVSHQQIAIEEITRETLYLLRTELTNRRATVILKVEPNCPRVRCDRVQLQQVLVNLVMNACDSMEGNPVADRVVVVSAEPFDAGVRIRVEDEGCGISPDLAAGRFTPFATTKRHGMGLGLTVCSTIIASHGGKLYGANKSPRGAVFTVDLGGHHGTRGIAA